jgi:hypothetical protein
MFPLDVLVLGLHGGKNAVGLLRRVTQGVALGRADFRYISFDDVAWHVDPSSLDSARLYIAAAKDTQLR